MDNWVGLSEAIAAIRRELVTAQLDGWGEPVRFDVVDVELEFLLEARKEGSGEAGLTFGISLGGKRTSSTASTHRIKLALTPMDLTTGGTVKITDDD